MTIECPPSTPHFPDKKQTHVLPSYDRVPHQFNETPLLDKVSPGMRLSALKVFTRGKVLKKVTYKIFPSITRKIKITEENQ